MSYCRLPHQAWSHFTVTQDECCYCNEGLEHQLRLPLSGFFPTLFKNGLSCCETSWQNLSVFWRHKNSARKAFIMVKEVLKKYLLIYLNQHLCPNGQPMRLFFPQVWHWTHARAHSHMHTDTRNTPQTCFIYQTMWMHILTKTQSLSVCQLNIFSVIFSLFKPSHALQSCLPEQLNLVVMCAFAQQAQCTL